MTKLVSEIGVQMDGYSSCKALIVGVGRYADPQYDLSYARSDAEAMAELLGNEFGFDQVWTLYDADATRQNLIRFFEQDLQRTDEDDGLLIFFAGHGITVISAIGDDRGFLVPHDGDPKEPYANLSLTTIRDDYMPMIPAKHVLLIVDACYGGLALRDVVTVERPKTIDDAVLAELTRRDRKVRQVLAAGSKDQKVLDGGLFGHSVFTGRLIEALREANPYITADHVGVHVRDRVARDAQDRKHRQTPQFGYLCGGEGTFVFDRSACEGFAGRQRNGVFISSHSYELVALPLGGGGKQSESHTARIPHTSTHLPKWSIWGDDLTDSGWFIAYGAVGIGSATLGLMLPFMLAAALNLQLWQAGAVFLSVVAGAEACVLVPHLVVLAIRKNDWRLNCARILARNGEPLAASRYLLSLSRFGAAREEAAGLLDEAAVFAEGAENPHLASCLRRVAKRKRASVLVLLAFVGILFISVDALVLALAFRRHGTIGFLIGAGINAVLAAFVNSFLPRVQSWFGDSQSSDSREGWRIAACILCFAGGGVFGLICLIGWLCGVF